LVFENVEKQSSPIWTNSYVGSLADLSTQLV
jgi:hypothetical protein